MKNKEDDKSIKKAADSHMIISWFSLMKALLTFTSILFQRNGSIEDQLQLTRNKSVKQTFCKITKKVKPPYLLLNQDQQKSSPLAQIETCHKL